MNGDGDEEVNFLTFLHIMRKALRKWESSYVIVFFAGGGVECVKDKNTGKQKTFQRTPFCYFV